MISVLQVLCEEIFLISTVMLIRRHSLEEITNLSLPQINITAEIKNISKHTCYWRHSLKEITNASCPQISITVEFKISLHSFYTVTHYNTTSCFSEPIRLFF